MSSEDPSPGPDAGDIADGALDTCAKFVQACQGIAGGRDTYNLLTDPFGEVVEAVGEALSNALATLSTVWISVGTPSLTGPTSFDDSVAPGEQPPTPQPSGVDSPQAPGGLEQILNFVMWMGFGVAILSLIVLGAAMAVHLRRGEGIAAVGKVGIIFAAVALISGAGGIASGLLASGPSVSLSGPVGFLQSQLWWFMLAAVVVSIVVGAIRMLWEQRAEPARSLMQSLLQLLVVAGASVTIITLALSTLDAFAADLISDSLSCRVDEGDGSCFADGMSTMLGFGDDPAQDPVGGTLIFIVLGLLAALGAMIQVMLMFLRGAMLVLLAGVLPFAASFTNTEMGRTWFRRALGWTIAFILYKPAAAVVYATAFQLIGDGGGDGSPELESTLSGMMLLLAALLALPAMMRFVAPITSAVASGSAAGAAGAAVGAAAMAALPTGAAAIGRLRGGGAAATAASRAGGNGSAPAGNVNPSSPTGGNPSGPSGTGRGPTGGTTASPPQRPPESGAGNQAGREPAPAGANSGGTRSTRPATQESGNGAGWGRAAEGARRGWQTGHRVQDEVEEGPSGSR